MKRGIIILGSSNSLGETYKVASYISKNTSYKIIDLKTKNILEFDYDFNNKNDDFIPLMKDLVDNYDLMIFATPVYWYSMSGIMKTFFDRISDCLIVEKEIGRKLRGKEMAVISCGSDKELKTGFHMPFIETANYLGMIYNDDVHCWIENNELSAKVKTRLDVFIKNIQE